jgi:hypothetical protein
MARAVVAPKNGIEKPPRRRRGPVGSDSPARARTTKKRIIEASRRWLRIINAHRLNDQERQRVVAETLDNFRLYYNRGYLDYRKSVTEGGEFGGGCWWRGRS